MWLFLAIKTVNEDIKSKRKIFGDNHVHNTLRRLDVCTNFPFTTSETKYNYQLQTGIYDLPHELQNDLRLNTLENQEILEKSQGCIELLPRHQSSF